MALHDRIAWMTGVLAGVTPPLSDDWSWRGAFLTGAVAGPVFYLTAGGAIDFSVPVTVGYYPGGAVPVFGHGYFETPIFMASMVAGIVAGPIMKARKNATAHE